MLIKETTKILVYFEAATLSWESLDSVNYIFRVSTDASIS